MDAGGFIATSAGYLLFLALLFFAWRAVRRRGHSPAEPVADGPADEPYRVYTRAYDLELTAGDVQVALPRASPDSSRGWYHTDHALWPACIPRVAALLAEQEAGGLWRGATLAARGAMAQAGVSGSDIVLSLLIDQSGSMKGVRIAWAAMLATQLSRLSAELGIKLEILGFSTAGWHGGHARAAWIDAGRPPRPGRLCALMHVIYKAADDPVLDEDARNVMLDPALLRENVDGEALLWAQSRLASRPERLRLLVVVSDGAPVDDSTLLHNGPSYLYRHVKAVLTALAGEENLVLGGLGIEHDVAAFYPISQSVRGPGDLAGAMTQLLPEMIAAGARADLAQRT